MWVLLALLAAVCTALRDAASKHASRTVHPLVIGFGVAAVPAVVLWTVVLLGRPAIPGSEFGQALLISGGINALTTPLIVLALRSSDLSLVTPLRSLTPAFMLPVAAVVLAERPSLTGGVDVGVIVAGAYLLNLPGRRAGPLVPFRALLRDPGARIMLLVAFLYSISATFDKIGTQASSPVFWAASVQGVVALLLAPLATWSWYHRGRSPKEVRSAAPEGATAESDPGAHRRIDPIVAVGLAGGFAAVAAVAQMTALTLTLAAYVIAVKRTSTLWSVLAGRALFQEARTSARLAGAGVMLAGLVMVTLS